MNNREKKTALILSVAIMTGGPACAAQPESQENSGFKKPSQENSASATTHLAGQIASVYFNDDRKVIIRNYYSGYLKSGKCPPGLAKKNNGCQPPGQLRKWHKGEHLPNDVAYYDLPRALIDELGRTPEGEKLVQVGTAVLLISIGTGLIIDAFDLQK